MKVEHTDVSRQRHKIMGTFGIKKQLCSSASSSKPLVHIREKTSPNQTPSVRHSLGTGELRCVGRS